MEKAGAPSRIGGAFQIKRTPRSWRVLLMKGPLSGRQAPNQIITVSGRGLFRIAFIIINSIVVKYTAINVFKCSACQSFF